MFPYTSDCSLLNENHDYDYPEYNSLRECKKCGAHIKYTKPQKLGNIDEENIYPDHPASDFYGQSDPDHVNRSPYIRFTDFIGIIEEIENALYNKYYNPNDAATITNQFVVRTISGLSRFYHYSSWEWGITVDNMIFYTINELGNITSDLEEKVKLFFTAYNSKQFAPKIIVEDSSGNPIELIDWKHLMATTEAYMFHVLIPAFWAGWGGDFATLCQDIFDSESLNKETTALQLMGGNSDFSFEDLLADTDAIGLAEYLSAHLNDTYTKHFLSQALVYYWQTKPGDRKASIINDIKGNLPLVVNIQNLASRILNRCEDTYLFTVMTPSGEEYHEDNVFDLLTDLDPNTSESSKKAGALAFAKYLLSESEDLRE